MQPQYVPALDVMVFHIFYTYRNMLISLPTQNFDIEELAGRHIE